MKVPLPSEPPAVVPSDGGSVSRPPVPNPFAHALGRVLSEREPTRARVPFVTAAAVLIALFEVDGQVNVWLLKRPQSLRTHAGQIALPGGKKDAADASLVETALREAEEEIGLPREAVHVLGVSDDYVTATRFAVTPVVGWIAEPFEPTPNPQEVARVFHAPFSAFRDKGLVRMIPFESVRRLVRSYAVGDEIVWGATAAILGSVASLAHIR